MAQESEFDHAVVREGLYRKTKEATEQGIAPRAEKLKNKDRDRNTVPPFCGPRDAGAGLCMGVGTPV